MLRRQRQGLPEVSGVLVVLGRQGSGKGTQCALLAERHDDVVHVSTGEVLRAAVSSGSPLGRRAGEIMAAGELMPDDVMCEIVRERLDPLLAAGDTVLLDGFPRTPAQAGALVTMTAPDSTLLGALLLDVPVEEASERMAGRGRHDDTAAGIARRLELYETQTAPLEDWFDHRGLLHRVDGVGDPERVFDRLAAVVADLAPDSVPVPVPGLEQQGMSL